MSILDRIQEPNDIKKIDEKDLSELAQDIREFLIANVSETGGHLASNLGCVELTIALHRAMDFPADKLVWDVGHQSYVHKILTGRKDQMTTLRKFGGLSGFPKTSESDCDAFNTGHSSTAMSAALGMACAREIKGTQEKIAAVVGDGSFTGGMVYEALNNMAEVKTGCLVVLNDNEMSIDHNVGGMSSYLSKLRVGQPYNDLKNGIEKALMHIPVAGEKLAKGLKRSKDSLKQIFVPGMFFEEMGVTYIGPIDGHNIRMMEETFRRAFKLNKPILVHVKTIKGKGYKYAEKHPCYFHGISSFDVATGKVKNVEKGLSYTAVFARKLVELGTENNRIVAITAAMSKGTGVNKFAEEFPDRTFDVGIAEEHAVTFAAGLAAEGMIPVVAVYSSFLQRAYDQILHDVCIQNLPVVFAIDRAGLVGSDGETHQGIFDYTYLSGIPNMHICAPKNKWELSDMMKFAVALDAPIAVRYPRGTAYAGLAEHRAPIELGKAEWIAREGGIALFAVGSMVKTAEEVQKLLHEKGYKASIINARFIKPIDKEAVLSACEDHEMIVTMEENVQSGGFGEKVLDCLNDHEKRIKCVMAAIPDAYVEHGNVELLKKEIGLDAESITEKILERL